MCVCVRACVLYACMLYACMCVHVCGYVHVCGCVVMIMIICSYLFMIFIFIGTKISQRPNN